MKNLIQTVKNEFELPNFWLIIPALYNRFLCSEREHVLFKYDRSLLLVHVVDVRLWKLYMAVVCPWRWIIMLSRGEICSITCWVLVQSHQHNMDYVSSAVCSMIMNWFAMRLCHFLVSMHHSRYKDGLIRLLDQFFCSYFVGFWVMQCTGGDLHSPCISAKEDKILGQLHYLLNSLIPSFADSREGSSTNGSILIPSFKDLVN